MESSVRALISRCIEPLESRQLLAALPAEVHINFQPPSVPAPSGYLVDSGKPMGNRGNGFVYGWNRSNYTYQQRNSPASPDVRYDTFVGMDSTSPAWFIQVPNGLYQVHVVAGDPSYAGSILRVNVKGAPAIAATTSASNPWAETTITVNVTNYLISISGASGTRHNTLDFVDIFPVLSRPNSPTSLTATAASDSGVNLAWTSPAGPVTGFMLQRSTDGSVWSTVMILSRNATHYTDTGLAEGTSYSYRLRAYNAKGTSDPATATATTLLAAPTSLQARSFANVPHIALSWTDNSARETGYIVERSQDGTNFTEVARLGPNVTSYDDTHLTAATPYTYRVRPSGSAPGLAATASAQTTDFRVFENTYFTNKPDLSAYGIETPLVIGGPFFWRADNPAGGYDMTTPNETATRNIARMAADAGQVLIIDIEHFPVDIRTSSPAAVQTTMQKLGQIVDWIRSERPNVKIGFYGIAPLRDYWTPVLYQAALDNPTNSWYQQRLAEFTANYQRWQQANDFLKPLIDKVDFIFPSLYTFYNDPTNWVYYAKGNIAEAERYGKPVIPFIWMEYHNSTPLAGQQLSPDFWKMQLQTLRQYAQGMVIWGGVTYSPSSGSTSIDPWSEQDPWWVTTRQFLAS
jgi:hypothetical protein